MSEYLTLLLYAGIYVAGFIGTLFLLARFGGTEMREDLDYDKGLNGPAIFLAIIWPLNAGVLSIAGLLAVVLSPVLIPAALVLWLCKPWRGPTPEPKLSGEGE